MRCKYVAKFLEKPQTEFDSPPTKQVFAVDGKSSSLDTGRLADSMSWEVENLKKLSGTLRLRSRSKHKKNQVIFVSSINKSNQKKWSSFSTKFLALG